MYIAFEGIEGSGKSLQISRLENYFKEKNYKYLITKEPGSTPVGIKIREILLNSNFSDMGKFTEIFLYIADRAEHYSKIIKPGLKNMDLILSDRSLYSTLVYQGFGRGIDFNLLKQLNEIVTDKIYPDYVFLFDLPVEVGLSRALKRESSKLVDEMRFEKEKIEFHRKIRKGYLELSQINRNNWYVINATKPVEVITEEIIKILEKLCK